MIPQNGQKRTNPDTFVPEIFIVDRWLDMEVIADCTVIRTACVWDIVKAEFGEKAEEAMKVLKKHHY